MVSRQNDQVLTAADPAHVAGFSRLQHVWDFAARDMLLALYIRLPVHITPSAHCFSFVTFVCRS